MTPEKRAIRFPELTAAGFPDRKELVLKWRSISYILLGVLVLVAFGIMVSTQWQTLTFSRPETGPYDIVMAIVAFVLVFFIYYCFVRFFNSTRITVFQDRMVVDHGPLPWHFDRVVQRKDLLKLDTAVRREKTSKGEGPPFFRIEAELKTGRRVPLTPYHEDPDLIKEVGGILQEWTESAG